MDEDIYDIDTNILPTSFSTIYSLSRSITKNIAGLLPRNSNRKQLIRLADVGEQMEVEENLLNGKVKTITAYYGDLVGQTTTTTSNSAADGNININNDDNNNNNNNNNHDDITNSSDCNDKI